MRFISLVPLVALTLLVVACVSVYDQQHYTKKVQDVTGAAAIQAKQCDIDTITSNHFEPHGSASYLNPDRISVLNWNIYKGNRVNWEDDLSQLAKQQDIITLQEAFSDNGLGSLLTTKLLNWSLNTAFLLEESGYGVMTASTVKPLHSCGQRMLEPLIRVPKTSLISYFGIADHDEYLLVANIHSINFTIGTEAYRGQLENLYRIMKHHQGPIIFAGDFNTWTDERMQIVDEMVDKLALKSLEYPSRNRTRLFGNALDHIFYRGLEMLEHDATQVTSSDHNPIRASFRLVNDNKLIALQ